MGAYLIRLALAQKAIDRKLAELSKDHEPPSV
jgi:hypothetical protein